MTKELKQKINDGINDIIPYKLGHIPATAHSQLPKYTCTHDLTPEIKKLKKYIFSTIDKILADKVKKIEGLKWKVGKRSVYDSASSTRFNEGEFADALYDDAIKIIND